MSPVPTSPTGPSGPVAPPPPGVELRGLRAEDLGDLAALLAEIEAVDRTEEHVDEDDLREEYAEPAVDGPRDWLGAYEGGRMVGFGQLTPRVPGEGQLRTYVWGGTHPDHRGRGIGTAVLSALDARLAQRHREVAPDHLAVHLGNTLTRNEEQGALLRAAGFAPDRYELVLGVDRLEPLQPPALPGGLLVRAYDPVADADALLATHNEVFRDHPDFAPWDADAWRHRVTDSRHFRPEVSRVVVDGATGAIAAYVQVEEWEAATAVTGRREAWVARVGTVRAHRGRGIAATLLQHVLEACRRAGFDRAALGVDSENPTGALGVYERAGFALEQHWTSYRREVPPLTSAS